VLKICRKPPPEERALVQHGLVPTIAYWPALPKSKMGAGVAASPHCSLRFALPGAGCVFREPVPAEAREGPGRFRRGSFARRLRSRLRFLCPKAQVPLRGLP
jgi:hypothetical protein